MTDTYNIWVGLSAWATSHSYTIGTYVSNVGNAYLCVKGGTSASTGTGPTLTISSIIDNSVIWQYVSNIDYTGATGDIALGNAYAALPSVFTQNIVWDIWNTGFPIQTSAPGTYFLNDTAGLTVQPFYWIIQAAPGNSIRDRLQTGTFFFSYGDGASGTSFLLPNAPPSGSPINYFNFNSHNVIISGLMFKDPIITSDCTILAFAAGVSNCILQYSILEGTSGTNAAFIVEMSAVGSIIQNCLIIDHALPGTATAACVQTGASTVVVASTIVGVLGNGVPGGLAGVGAIDAGVNNGVFIVNCMLFGYGNTTFQSSAQTIGVIDCMFDNPIFPNSNGGNDDGGNLFGLSLAAQVRNSNNDFRLVSTSSAIDAGQNLTNNIPASDDIAYTQRPQGAAWDIGPWEYKSSGSVTKAIVFKMLIG